MKRILLITVALTMVSLGTFAQNVNIPDANFKAYLVGNTNINTNGDTEIQVSEANDFTGTININNDGVSDLTGIEHFTNLTYLIAPFNQLTSIDVSQNTALLSLNVQDNMLTSLDISQNTALTSLNCGRNNLSSLDVSQNVLLDFLLCHENNLSSLDVYPLTNLITFNCSQNSITYLDFSQNTGINQNTSLEIPFLYCQENNLTVLKMNGISPGSLQNQYFNATSNPNLTCIEVNDVTAAETNWTNIDAAASFSLDCGYPVYIPDANFKAYLVGNSAINTNSDAEIQVSEAAAFTGTISINSSSISDLTGIEAFTALEHLYASNNSITTLDLSNNTNLLSVYCNLNSLTSLNVSNNTNLEMLYCQDNSLTELDLNSNTSLTNLSCLGNSLTSLKITNGNNTNFNVFNATNNPSLTCIEVDDPAWSTTNWVQIDAGASFSLNCSPLYIPDANFKAYLVGNTNINTNGDSEIQIGEAAAFTGQIDCSGDNISDLTGIEAFTALTDLRCNSNNLTSLDISQNIALTQLWCGSNNLSSLDISQNTSLSILACGNQSINTLDVSQNPALTYIEAFGNNLSSIDISNNVNLTTLDVSSNNINTLDISQNTALTALFCQSNDLTALHMKNASPSTLTNFNASSNPNLTCIEVDDAAAATANWTNIDATAGFSTNCNYLVSSISVYGQSNVSTISISGGTLQMEAMVLPAYAGDASYTWSVTNGTGSATIDANGLLTAVSDGTVTVTATANDGSGVSDDAEITISNQIVLVSSITVQGQAGETAITTHEGTLQMEATVSPTNATDATYVWSVTNGTGAATIDANGLLSAVSNGTVTVTATANDDSEITGDVIITISNQIVLVSAISVQGQAGATAITTDGGTLQMEATVSPANATNATYAWSVTNGTGAATIDANGLLTAVSNGTVTVTATANDGSEVSGDAEITISNQIVLVNSITVQGQGGATTITANEGTLQMEATVLPANATDATYVWAVTNGTGEATIDANGLLTAVSNGTVTVTATANDDSGVSGDAIVTISNQVVLSVDDQYKSRDWLIYPNPVSSVLNFDSDQAIEAVTIVDFTGKPIKTISSSKKIFDVSDLAIGIYFLQIKTDKGLMSKKFIKQ